MIVLPIYAWLILGALALVLSFVGWIVGLVTGPSKAQKDKSFFGADDSGRTER